MNEHIVFDAALIALRAQLRRRHRGSPVKVESAFADLAKRLTTTHAHEAVERIYALGLVRRTH